MITIRQFLISVTLAMTTVVVVFASDISLNQNLPVQLKGDLSSAAEYHIQRLLPPDNEFRVENRFTDEFGYTYISLQHYVSGVPVDGSRILLHIDQGGVLYKIGGIIISDITVRKTGKEITPEKASQFARSAAITSRGRKMISSEDNNILPQEKIVQAYAKEPRLLIRGNRLVYSVFAREGANIDESAEYVVDAQNGSLISKKEAVLDLTPPNASGYQTTVQGRFLQREVNPENGINSTSFLGWRDNPAPQNYFLNTYSNPTSRIGGFGIVNCHSTGLEANWEWERNISSDWGALSPSAISAAKNITIMQNWVTSFLNLYSLNNAGMQVTCFVDYRRKDELPMNNAFWVPGMQEVYFGDGDNSSFGHFTALDAVTHELGHGITESFSNMASSGEPRALHESYSDIMATTVEFMTQPSAAANYPFTVSGKADWLIGEDITIGKTAWRDLRIGQREMNGGSLNDVVKAGASYYNGNRYWDTNTDGDWNPYQGSQVQSFAFYLLSEGASSTMLNNGQSYGPFQGLGIQAAAKIAMRADIVELFGYTHSCLIDSRAAWERAADYLVGQGAVPSNARTLVSQVWNAVGVKNGVSLRFVYSDHPNTEIGSNGNMKLSGWCAVGIQPPGLGQLRFTNTDACAVLDGTAVDGVRSINIKGTFQEDKRNNFGDLTGSLVIRSPDGVVQMALNQNGNLLIGEKQKKKILY